MADQAYADAEKQIEALPKPSLLPRGIKHGADLSVLGQEFHSASFDEFAKHVTDRPHRPAYFNPCWVKAANWGPPIQGSKIFFQGSEIS